METREERIEKVNRALALSTLDAPEPDDFTMDLTQQYIDGVIGLDELQRRVIEHY